jgi:hypothetical protein
MIQWKNRLNASRSTRVIKGYEQREGIDYDETYAPVSKMATFRLLLALAAQYGWDIDHMDLVTAFLNLKIDHDDIHVEIPLGMDWLTSSRSTSNRRVSNGCVSNGRLWNGSMLILRKALYGLKQALGLWYEEIDRYLQSIGFSQLAEDPNLYILPGVLLVLYVDDLVIAHKGVEGKGHQVKQLIQKKHKIYDLGVAKRFRKNEIENTKDGGFSICQQDYINTVIRHFGLMESKPGKSPLEHQTDLANTHCENKLANHREFLSMVVSLMYAALGSRPDIVSSVTALS